LVGGFRLKGYAHQPAIGTHGGILVLWDENIVYVSDIFLGAYCISMTFTRIRGATSVRLWPD
jgi:hypothetical protein